MRCGQAPQPWSDPPSLAAQATAGLQSAEAQSAEAEAQSGSGRLRAMRATLLRRDRAVADRERARLAHVNLAREEEVARMRATVSKSLSSRKRGMEARTALVAILRDARATLSRGSSG